MTYWTNQYFTKGPNQFGSAVKIVRKAAVGNPAKLTSLARGNWRFLDSVTHSLKKLLLLKTNWDGYGAPPIKLATAKTLLADLMRLQQDNDCLWAPSIVPAADGSLQAEWDSRDLEILFLVDEDGKRVTYIEDRKSGREFEAENNAAVVLALRFCSELVARQVPSSEMAFLGQRSTRNATTTNFRMELA